MVIRTIAQLDVLDDVRDDVAMATVTSLDQVRCDPARLDPARLDPARLDNGQVDQSRAETARRHRPAPTEIWHPWASRGWPATTVEERAFIEQLRRMSDDAAGHHERRDVTALVTALRSGLTADDLFERARGLRPGRLLAAHEALELRRIDVARAWSAIEHDPSLATFEHHADDAATLLPVVISHLTSVAHRQPSVLDRAIAEAAAQLRRTSNSVALLEEQLDLCVPPSDRGVEIGALLFDRRGEGAWSLSTFLPERIGQLVPLRVAALLGEGRTFPRTTGW